MKNIEYLIIPDIHGRSFWKDAVNEVLKNSDSKIIFLGDYLDPYPQEFDISEDPQKIAIDNFKEIIELKENNSDRIILLLGNHDEGYCISKDICSCRMDLTNIFTINELFSKNKNLFLLAHECTINNKHFIFSHAGILKDWVEFVWESRTNDESFNVVNELNNAWLNEYYDILDYLGMYDSFRGFGGAKVGSPSWSDIRSWINIKPEETYGFNIVGHTMCNNPIIFDTIACLDCKEVFYLDNDGNIRNYKTDEIPLKTEIN